MADTWSYSAGEYGATVRVYERVPGSPLYIAYPHPDFADGYKKESLGHRDRKRARAKCHRIAEEIGEGRRRIRAGEVTLTDIFDLYERYRTPEKSEKQQQADQRRIAMWKRVLGAGMDPHRISAHQWRRFVARRQSGEIDSYGRPSDAKSTVTVSTVRHDCAWLRQVLRWATRWRTDDGFLLDVNPVRGFDLPRPKHQPRPVATRERYEALMKAGADHEMRFYRDGTATWEPSYFTELLDLAVHTGRRIGAIIALRRSDLLLERTDFRPHGGIQWPGETDKQGRPWTAPLHPVAREALDTQLRRVGVVGNAHLFPAPRGPEGHVHPRTVERWMETLEEEAGLEHLDGALWHPYRRMWASERRHLPDVDVARAGGWSDPSVMQRSYQEADETRQYEVVTGAVERRESRADSG